MVHDRTTMSNPQVHYRKDGHVAVLTLEAPPANCYSFDLMRALDARILEARFDPEVEVIVLTAAGDKFFCAGADIEMLKAADPTWKYYFCLHANETLSRLEQTPKLVIAALNGHTVGGGLEVALACDLRIARAGRRQDRAARGQARRAAGNRRAPSASPASSARPRRSS